jgi:hypothetical protein
LPALMRSGSSSPSYGNGPMPSMPFSDCSTRSFRRNVVGHQRRDADAEVDVVTVAQFLRGALRRSSRVHGHQAAPSCAPCAARCASGSSSLDDPLHEDARRVTGRDRASRLHQLLRLRRRSRARRWPSSD